MKVVAINGSPRKNGNTSILINTIFDVLNQEAIETEQIQIGNKKFHPCTACMKCHELKDNRCFIKNDIFNECIEKMISADGIILGSPVYVADMTAEMKAFIDVAAYVARANRGILKHKIGVAIAAVRRAGAIHTLDSMNHFFQISEMIIPCSTYWNFAIGRNIGEVLNDSEGIETMQNLGRNIAWLMKKLSS